ncbi:hypothetical protein Taro_007250 [Colocasia esculenta]|uniref:Uncharacterized protein n=1 Tax=Colocasia esculenta TaxID=4460 RepID=A0A843TTJ6_COLES|nr:hypothetical protein [Colocasia esculenta]
MQIFVRAVIGTARESPIWNRHFDPVGTRTTQALSRISHYKWRAKSYSNGNGILGSTILRRLESLNDCMLVSSEVVAMNVPNRYDGQVVALSKEIVAMTYRIVTTGRSSTGPREGPEEEEDAPAEDAGGASCIREGKEVEEAGVEELRVVMVEWVCEREKKKLGAWLPRSLQLPQSAQTHSPLALMALTLAQLALEAS